MDAFIKIDISDIESSNIKNILYVVDGESIKADGDRDHLGTLLVTFQSNSVYKFVNVKLTDVVSFISYSSFGSGFNRYIRKYYAGESVVWYDAKS